MVAFQIEGPTIETRVIHVVTRPGVGAADLRVPEGAMFFGGGKIQEMRLKPYYPPTFTHTADPGRSVTGVVRDKASGKPIAGAIVRGEQPVRFPAYFNTATTDKDGRYTLTVYAAMLHDAAGNPLDGDGNGTPQDNLTFAFHRLFGDADGSATIDQADFAAFRAAYGAASNIFDADGNNIVDQADFSEFRARFGVTI